ncbi:MAG: MFS transporter, partial [Lacrimispora sp.]
MNKNTTFHLFGAIIAAGILSFSGVLIETAMNVTFPSLIQEFGVTTSGIQWVTTIYLLMISVIVPISSYLNRNFSIRGQFITANLFF